MTFRARPVMLATTAMLLVSPPARAQALDRSRRPVPPPARPFSLPAVATRTLPNGLRLEVVENHELPIVAVRVVFAADSTYDPAGKEGLAAATLAMLREGTTHESADQLTARMATLGTPVTPAGFTTTTAHLRASLELLADMLLHPTFPESAFTRIIAARVAASRQQQAVPSLIARSIMYRQLYGAGHPFFRIPSEATLTTITRDDLRRFHHDYLRPQNVTIVVVGDVRQRDVVGELSRTFGGWTRAGITVEPHVEPVAEAQPATIYLYDAPGAPQATIFIGQMGPPRSTPDYVTLEMANSIFGATSESRLWDVLRFRHGWAYSVSSASLWRRVPEPSTIRGSSNVTPAKTDSVLIAWLGELNAIRGERPPTSDELERARMALVGSLPIQLETVDEMADAFARLAAFGESADYYERLARGAASVTSEDVVRAARAYFDPGHLVIVVAGDRKVIEPGLRAANLAPIVVVDAAGRAAQ